MTATAGRAAGGRGRGPRGIRGMRIGILPPARRRQRRERSAPSSG